MQTWFYEANKKAEIGKRKYWIYYKKGIATVKAGIKKAKFRLEAEKIRSDSANSLKQQFMGRLGRILSLNTQDAIIGNPWLIML